MIPDERLNEIEKRCDWASEGPWHVYRKHQLRGIFSDQCKVATCTPHPQADGVKLRDINEEFIAHARTDLPDCVKEIRLLRKELKLENHYSHELIRELRDIEEKK